MTIPERTLSDLPGPRGLPLLGSSHRLLRVSRAHLALEQWSRDHGPIFKVRAGPRTLVAVRDADAIDTILRDRPQGYRRWNELVERITEMGEGPPGLFVSEGDAWKRQRRLVVKALNAEYLHRYFGVIHAATERLRLRLERAARGPQPVPLADTLSSYTLEVISALAFGCDLDALEADHGELQLHIRRVLRMTARRVAAPVSYWRVLKLPGDRALERSMHEVYRAVDGFIATARRRLAERPERYDAPENFLEGMLAAQREDRSITDREVANNAITLLFGGEDTTSATLAWTAWLLAVNPDVQERLRASVAAALPGEAVPSSYRDLERLTYAEAVLRESMRLRSVVPAIAVEPIEDKTVCGTRIPAGTRMVLLTREARRATAGRSEEFYPERWLGDDAATRPSKLLNFGSGPRFCPGRNLSFVEAKAALATIAGNFELRPDAAAGPVRESLTNAVVPLGLRLRVEARPPAE